MANWDSLRLPTERDLLVGFYDLTGYVTYAAKRPPRDVLDVLAGYFRLTGAIIAEAGGKLIKTLGDAGLFIFFAEDADAGVRAMMDVQRRGDAWVAERGYKTRAIVKTNVGPVALGLVGAPGDERLDVYGKTVNIAATLDSAGFTMTPAAFRALSPETRMLFKKHMPPISYIAADDRHGAIKTPRGSVMV